MAGTMAKRVDVVSNMRCRNAACTK